MRIIDKELLIDAIMGTQPSYETMNNSIVDKCGYYVGGFRDEWHWKKDEIEKLSPEEMNKLYSILKGKRNA